MFNLLCAIGADAHFIHRGCTKITFTVEAKREARRDGAPPIELVDGVDLVTLLKIWSLDSVRVKTFDVDDKFFDDSDIEPRKSVMPQPLASAVS